MRRERCGGERQIEWGTWKTEKNKKVVGWGKESTLVTNHQHITGREGEAAGCGKEQVCIWVADKRHSITYASLEGEHQSGAGWAARVVCLCVYVSVCDKELAVCYRLSLAPAFPSLVTHLLEATILFSDCSLTHTNAHTHAGFLSANPPFWAVTSTQCLMHKSTFSFNSGSVFVGT